jgi:hypothetical protein
MYGTIQLGLANWMGFIWSLLNTVFAYMFNLSSGHLTWSTTSTVSGTTSVPQIQLGGSIPQLSAKGQDIMAAIMTIVHNGLVFVAELSTLLPSNNLVHG